jgi:hypothetical protein
MSVKLKISADAPEACVEQVLEVLHGHGLVAERMFPGQKRAALARIFIIRTKEVQAAEVASALERFGDHIEYVEGAVTRKTVGLRTDPP